MATVDRSSNIPSETNHLWKSLAARPGGQSPGAEVRLEKLAETSFWGTSVPASWLPSFKHRCLPDRCRLIPGITKTNPTAPLIRQSSAMKTVALTAFSIYVTASLAASTRTYSCDDKEDGLYIGGCTTFYRCQNRTTELIECQRKLVVNPVEMWCDYSEKVSPPCGTALNCTGLFDGNYPDFKRKCRFYYTCLREDFYGYTRCPGALVFDTIKDSCDWPNLVKPPCGTGNGS